MLNQLRHQINGLTLNDELRVVLRQEQRWLERAEVVLSQHRLFREQDALRFWPGVVRRWLVALVLALSGPPPPAPPTGGQRSRTLWRLQMLRTRMEFVEFVERRVVTMTPGERR